MLLASPSLFSSLLLCQKWHSEFEKQLCKNANPSTIQLSAKSQLLSLLKQIFVSIDELSWDGAAVEESGRFCLVSFFHSQPAMQEEGCSEPLMHERTKGNLVRTCSVLPVPPCRGITRKLTTRPPVGTRAGAGPVVAAEAAAAVVAVAAILASLKSAPQTWCPTHPPWVMPLPQLRSLSTLLCYRMQTKLLPPVRLELHFLTLEAHDTTSTLMMESQQLTYLLVSP